MDSDIDYKCRNSRGESLIQVAILNGHYEIANLILSRTVEHIPQEDFISWFEAAVSGEVRPLKILKKGGIHIDLPNKQGRKLIYNSFPI